MKRDLAKMVNAIEGLRSSKILLVVLGGILMLTIASLIALTDNDRARAQGTNPLFFGCSNRVTFDNDNENWRVATTRNGTITVMPPQPVEWQPNAGNPGGAVIEDDLDTNWTELWTPELAANGYSTDYSFAIGGLLQFDYRNNTGIAYDVYMGIVGANGSFYWFNFEPQIIDSAQWTRIVIPLDAAQWMTGFNNDTGPTGPAPSAVDFAAALEDVDRFTFSIEGQHGPDGTAFDNFGQPCNDYGDSPAGYGVLREDNGPSHEIIDFNESTETAPLMLGDAVSIEDDGQPSVGADADTFDDGVADPIVLFADQQTEVDVLVTNDTDDVATLAGWIDQNANGTFELGERVTLEVPANSGVTTQTLTFPASALLRDDTYARFRVFPGSVADPQPTGIATGGEVEDYLVQNAAVQYNKTVSPLVTEITPGQTFTYTVTVENTGAGDLIGLSFTDNLADVVDDAVYNADATADIGTAVFNAPDEIAWSGDLAVGQTATITYSVTMNDPVTGDGVLINSVVGDGPGSNCTDDPAIDPSCTTTVPLPDVSSQKTLIGPVNPQPGDVVDYQFTITNAGDSAVTGVAAADDLSGVLDDATYNGDAVASSGTVTFSAINERLNWNGDLAASGDPGDVVTVTYSVTVNAADELGDGVLLNALISPDCPNPPIFDTGNPDYNADCVTETAIEAWMATKSVNPSGTVDPGTVLEYTIEVENVGGADLTGLSVDDDLTNILDDATFNNDESATVGSASYTAPTLNWTGDLTASQSATITYTVTVNDVDSLGDGVLSNVITGPMNCPSGDCETETLVSAWTIQKQSSPAGPVQAGDVVEYTIEVENVGGAAVDADFTDNLTEILDDASYNNDLLATVGTADYVEPIVSWEGALTPGQTSTITYSVTVDAASPDGDGVMTNAAVAPSAGCPDPAITNPTDPNFNANCVTVTLVEEWIATKSVTPDGTPVAPGEVVTYNIVIENTGATDLTGLSVNDDLSSVIDDASYNNDAAASVGDVDYTAPTLTWEGDLAQGENAIVSYSVTVNAAGELGDGVLNNVITGAPNCPSDVCTTSTPVSIFEVEKTSNPEDGSNVQPGDHITYNVSIHNTGSVALTNFSFDDNLSNVLNNAQLTGSAAVEPSSAGTTNISGTTLSFSGTINAGETVHVSYTVQVNQDAPANVELRNVVTGAFSNCVTGEEPECLTTHTVVPPQGTLPSLAERLAETGRHLLLPIILGASLLVSGILLYRRWAR